MYRIGRIREEAAPREETVPNIAIDVSDLFSWPVS
jgi:hypothetical protein